MTEFVKEFIEKNIDQIENNKWNEVFLNWYNDAEKVRPAQIEFEEFISICHDVGIELNLGIAHDVIQGIIEDKIIAEQNSMFQTNHISIFGIVINLNCFLGHSEQDIKKIIDDIATKHGMHYTPYYGGGYTW